MPYSTSIISTRHADISLRASSGTGPPLLMIHGSGSCKEVFARQFDSPLADRYRMIALDLPGHGGSSDARFPEAAYTVHGFAECVADVIDALHVDSAIVFGWSLGGHIGIELLSFSAAVAGLMLTGTPPIAPGPLGMLRGFQTNWDLLLASKAHFSERDALHFYSLCFGSNGEAAMLEAIRRSDGRLRAIAVKSMMRGDGADQKRTVEQAMVPIAMVNGQFEPFVRLGYVAGLDYANLWDKSCHVIQNAGHAPFWDQPEEFNALLGRFSEDVAMHRIAEPARMARSA